MSTGSIQVRETRDRLIDLLGFAKTFPLRDLAVKSDQVVAFGTTAKIPIADSQKDVTYQLFVITVDADGTEHAEAASGEVSGTGGETVLETTAPIQNDTTFSILAKKQLFPAQRAYLLARATVKIGLDINLTARILSPLLDKSLLNPVDNAARIVDFGASVQVQLDNSQEGVDYRLVYFNEPADWSKQTPLFSLDGGFAADLDAAILPQGLVKEFATQNKELGAYARVEVNQTGVAWTVLDSGQAYRLHLETQQRLNVFVLEEVVLTTLDVRGNLQTRLLTSQPVSDDIDLRIRATKTFDFSEARPTQTTLLNLVLPLKVRADTTLKVSSTENILDFNTKTNIVVSNTQSNAFYQLFVQPIPDEDFVHKADINIPLLTISPGAGEPEVRVAVPGTGGGEVLPGGFTAVSEAVAGNGKDLVLDTGPLTADSLFLVQVRKDHSGSVVISSFVQLPQLAGLLIRPDPAPGLRLRIAIVGSQTSGPLEVFNGQPGVFYYFQRDLDQTNLGLPAYFYKSDKKSQGLYRGVGQLRIEVDFVVARSHPFSVSVGGIAQLPPETPQLETGLLDTDTTLSVTAVKALTGVATPLKDKAQIRSGPDVSLVAGSIPAGTKAQIQIKGSRKNENYRLQTDDISHGDFISGTGKDLTLETMPLQQDNTVQLLIQQTDSSIIVERMFSFTVTVTPANTGGPV